MDAIFAYVDINLKVSHDDKEFRRLRCLRAEQVMKRGPVAPLVEARQQVTSLVPCHIQP